MARSRTSRSTAWWPRCTPSNAPIVTARPARPRGHVGRGRGSTFTTRSVAEHDRRLHARAAPLVDREQLRALVEHGERARARRRRAAARAPRTSRRARPRAPRRRATTIGSRSRIACRGVSTDARRDRPRSRSSGCASSTPNDPTRSRRSVAEVRASAERRPEIGRERADVGAARAVDHERRLGIRARLERLRPRCGRCAPCAASRSTSLPSPRELVQPPALHLQRRHHRRDLLRLAEERLRRLLDLLARTAASRPARAPRPTRRACRSRCRTRRARGTTSSVSCRKRSSRVARPEPDEQHAGRVGIERARVADPPLPDTPCAACRRRRATSTPPACRRPPARRVATRSPHVATARARMLARRPSSARARRS